MAVTTEPAAEPTFRGAYDLTEDQELFKRTVHEFAAREIVPVAHELDEREEYPRQTVARMGELGLLGLLVPEAFGGAGAQRARLRAGHGGGVLGGRLARGRAVGDQLAGVRADRALRHARAAADLSAGAGPR